MTYDLVVVGAGPAGAAAGIAAARRRTSVALIGAARSHRGAVEMLSPHAVLLLRELDIFSKLELLGGAECPGIRTLWPGGDAVRRSICDLNGAGWIVDRGRLDIMLLEAARQAGAHIVDGRVRSVSAEPDGWLVDYDRQVPLTASTLIVATGRSMRIARQRGVIHERAGEEVTLLARLQNIGPQWRADPLLLVERTASGWMYGLPLEGGALIGASLDPARLANRQLEDAWCEAVQPSRSYRQYCAESRVEQVWGLPSGTAYALQTSGENWAIAGDTAMSCGPVSGQGLAFAIESGIYAANCMMGDEVPQLLYSDWVANAQRRYAEAAKELASAA